MVIVRCFLIVFCLLLPSCTKRHAQSNISNVEQSAISQRNQAQLDAIIQKEAMLIDIPIPLYDERIIDFSDDEINSDTHVFGYKSPLDYDQVTVFFMQQMERYGWRHLVSFNMQHESMLQFESPNRYCTVLIKKYADILGTSIFIYTKRASS